MKKILQVTGAMNMGGTETMLINLYRKINKDIQFDFISYSDKEAYYDKEIIELGGNIIRLKPPNEIGFIGAIKDIRRVIKDNGPYNAVHTHMMFNCGVAMIAAYISGIKIRISHAHTTADEGIGFIRKLYMGLMRFSIKLFSTNFLACSNSAGKYLFGRKIINNKKYKILPNYINYDKFINCTDKTSIREELGIKSDDIVLCHIGRFINAKNHEFLIEIVNEMIKKNSKVKLILVGDGELRKHIESKVRKLKIEKNVYFTGIRKDIHNILNNADLFILPSIYEGLGLVLLEAQAAKVPCLVSEAIQPEADLGVRLIKKMNLSYGADKWSEEVIKLIEKNKFNNIDINKALKEKKYDLNNILSILLEIYKLS